MNKLTYYLPFIFMLTLLYACQPPEVPTDLTVIPLIPKPVSVQATGNSFKLTGKTVISVGENLEPVGQYLADRLAPATGFGLAVKPAAQSSVNGGISLSLVKDPELGTEGYGLDISKEGIKITANQPAGLFYGVQTLLQVLPAKVDSGVKQAGPWKVATGVIRDFPNYTHRGSMLDVSRHFFSVEDVKRYIDLLAVFKMNVLHLHLSDDQGWRIEIKKWPNLTVHGGSTEVGGGSGGFYTQQQYADIVKYAGERFITIIPEIDMPGHTNAALASYAELNCDGKATELYTGTDVGFSTFCTNKEITYQFIDDVVAELAAITPGPYIHIGGDESHATKKEDYLPFVNRVKDIVEAHGKKMVGWDETAQADIGPGNVVQLWNNADFAKQAVNKGAKLIMSPATKAYLDMQYDSTSRIGLHWAAFIEVDSGYIWDPAKLYPGINKENIIGVEAPLWTETVTNMNDIEYLVFPRLLGYAEIGWTPPAAREWDSYHLRLAHFGERMKALGIDFYRSELVEWDKQEKASKLVD